MRTPPLEIGPVGHTARVSVGAKESGAWLRVMRMPLFLVIRRGGDVLPWIGPALRGIVARQLKNNLCRHAPNERETRWKYCQGCAFAVQCDYAQLYEPDAMASTARYRGQKSTLRPFVLAPCFPINERLRCGDQVGAQAIAVGGRAAQALTPALATLAQAGEHPGLGPDCVRFDVYSTGPTEQAVLCADDLPESPTQAPGTLPRLTVQLTSPLFLARRGETGRREMLLQPGLGDLLRAAMRTISAFFAQHGTPLSADFEALEDAADSATPAESRWKPLRQWRSSHRTRQQYRLLGLTGCAAFHDVPAAVLPWLVWGGRLHVGQHRVAGAGGWHVILN